VKKDLVKLIIENPGARFIVDNDCWSMELPYPDGFDAWSESRQDEWREEAELACDGEVFVRGDGGYGSGSCYGGDILQALAEIVGVSIESV
jgi:hypothetical protein